MDGYFNYYEQIHLLGGIQDQGFILSVKVDSPNVIRVTSISENITKAKWMRETKSENILGRNLYDLFEYHIAFTMESMIQRFKLNKGSSESNESNARNFSLLHIGYLDDSSSPPKGNNATISCSIVNCSNKDTYLLELETIDIVPNDHNIPNNHILQSGDIVGRIKAADTILGVTTAFCDSVMEFVPGYDRGMVYMFREDFTGDVIYENISPKSRIQSSYLHLRFPAEDIPAQARALFVKNGVRFIYDVNGVDSSVLSIENERLDLSMSCLRGVSSCHIQYLKNMGVVASMAVAIVVNGELWGLYTFHSYSNPTKPSVEQRITLEMAGSISSMRIDSFQREKNANRKLELNNLMIQLQTMKNTDDFLTSNCKDLLKVMECQSIVLYDDKDGAKVYGDDSILPTEEVCTRLLLIMINT